MSTMQRCTFWPCSASYHSFYDLGRHRKQWHYKHHYAKATQDPGYCGEKSKGPSQTTVTMVEEVEADSDDMCDSLNVRNEVDKSEDLRACADLIIPISREASKRLAKDKLNFLHETCLINSDYKTHVKSLHKCKTFADESMTAKLSGLKMEPLTIHETDNCLREKQHTL